MNQFFESVFLFRFDSLFQSDCQLVRAGGGLGAAADALDDADDFFSGTADAEGCDALGVAGAAAGEATALTMPFSMVKSIFLEHTPRGVKV